MSDHKRCKACGRIEEVTLRQEHEERMQMRIERFRTETHAQRSDRLVGGRCSASTMGFGGKCLSCGWQEQDASIERVIQHQRRMARLQAANRQVDEYEEQS